jgi:hypothetical protein
LDPLCPSAPGHFAPPGAYAVPHCPCDTGLLPTRFTLPSRRLVPGRGRVMKCYRCGRRRGSRERQAASSLHRRCASILTSSLMSCRKPAGLSPSAEIRYLGKPPRAHPPLTQGAPRPPVPATGFWASQRRGGRQQSMTLYSQGPHVRDRSFLRASSLLSCGTWDRPMQLRQAASI